MLQKSKVENDIDFGKPHHGQDKIVFGEKLNINVEELARMLLGIRVDVGQVSTMDEHCNAPSQIYNERYLPNTWHAILSQKNGEEIRGKENGAATSRECHWSCTDRPGGYDHLLAKCDKPLRFSSTTKS